MQPIKFGVGQAVPRLEDDSLLRGAGRGVQLAGVPLVAPLDVEAAA